MDGALGNSVTVEMGTFAPGIFLVAHGIYATGLGPVNGAQPGQPASETPTVRVGDAPAIVEFAQLTPGLLAVLGAAVAN